MSIKTNTEIIDKLYSKGEISLPHIDSNELSDISTMMTNIDNSNYNILDLFQDINELLSTLSALIVSPNNIGSTIINVDIEGGFEASLLSDLRKFIEDDVIDKGLNLYDKVEEIVHEAKCTKGAYVQLFIPKTLLNKIEDTRKKNKKKKIDDPFVSKDNALSLLGSTILKSSMEGISITSDLSEFIKPEIELDNDIKSGLESYFDTLDIDPAIENDTLDFTKYIDGDSANVIVKKINHERVIPICDPDDPSNHIGYYLLSKRVKKRESGTTFNLTQLERLSDGLKKANENIKMLVEDKNLSNHKDVYKELVKVVLASAYKHGRVEIPESEALDLIIDELLKGGEINAIFVPKFMIQYYAFDYRNNGTGRSMLEKVLPLTSIRAVLWMADIVNTIKAAVPITKLSANLGDKIADQKKIRKMIIDKFMEANTNNLPVMGMVDLNHLTSWAQNMGMVFNIKGSQLPDIDLDVEYNNMNKMIDITESDNRIKKAIAMAFNLPPEFSDSDFIQERAIAILESNKMLRKRIINDQSKFNRHMTEAVTKLIRLDKTLYNKLYKIVEVHKKRLFKRGMKADKKSLKEVTNLILKSITVSLPAPETKNDPKLLGEMFDTVNDNIDKAIEVILSEDLFSRDIMEQNSDKFIVIKSGIKAILMRRWMAKNGYMEDIEKLFNKDDRTMDELLNYINNITKNMKLSTGKLNKLFEKLDKSLSDKDNDLQDGNTEPLDQNDDNPQEPQEPTENNDDGNDETPDELTPPNF